MTGSYQPRPVMAPNGHTDSGAPLSKRQIAWLRFHAGEPTPTRWGWQTADNAPVRGAPDTWRRLRAWKRFRRAGRWAYRTCFITPDEMDALDNYLKFPVLTPEGLALLAALSDGAGHGTASNADASRAPGTNKLKEMGE